LKRSSDASGGEHPGGREARDDADPLPLTEAVNPRSRGLDALDALGILRVLDAENRAVLDAVGGALEAAAALVDRVVEALRRGGRLIYAGAGTSGRLGVLDAAECPPTFGVAPETVVGVIAGGDAALRRSVEGAEDHPEDGARAIAELAAGPDDVVCGIAASGATPFVLGALEEAGRRGAATALISANPLPAGFALARGIGHVIEIPVGPEVIAGSTRLKAGTATKLILNGISTAVMVRLGKVYDNRMVDLRPVNRKLVRRAVRLIEEIGRVDEQRAGELLEASGRDVKVAIVMARRGVDAGEARRALERAGGFLRAAIGEGEAGGAR
jgi:N-acetylmuramic acid 6-phosphate etherase